MTENICFYSQVDRLSWRVRDFAVSILVWSRCCQSGHLGAAGHEFGGKCGSRTSKYTSSQPETNLPANTSAGQGRRGSVEVLRWDLWFNGRRQTIWWENAGTLRGWSQPVYDHMHSLSDEIRSDDTEGGVCPCQTNSTPDPSKCRLLQTTDDLRIHSPRRFDNGVYGICRGHWPRDSRRLSTRIQGYGAFLSAPPASHSPQRLTYSRISVLCEFMWHSSFDNFRQKPKQKQNEIFGTKFIDTLLLIPITLWIFVRYI